MAIRGTLQEMSLGDLLQLLALGRKQGRLVVAGAGEEAVFRFRDGAVVDAGFRHTPPRLPRRLAWLGLGQGALSPDLGVAGVTEAEAAAHLLAPRRTAGETAGGGAGEAAGATDLRGAAAACVDEAVWRVLGWAAGSFTFESGDAGEPIGADGAPLLRRPVDALLLEAARRADEWPRLRRLVPSLTAAIAPVAGAHPGDRGIAARLWRWLDGRRGAQALADETALELFVVVEALAAWGRSGAIRFLPEAAAPVGDPWEPPPTPAAAPAERFREAVARLRQGAWGDAVALLESVAGPEAPAAVHHNLALGLEQLGRHAEAARHAAWAREKAGGGDARLTVSEAMLALQTGDAVRADRLLGEAPVPDPCPAAWYHARGVAALLVGDVTRAVATLEAGVVAYPADPGLLVNLGAARLAAGDGEEAVRVLRRALRVAPRLAAAHKALGDAHYAAQRWDDALAAYREVVALAPSHGPDVHGRMGDIHFRRGEVAEARAAWARALAIDPAHRIARGGGQEVAA